MIKVISSHPLSDKNQELISQKLAAKFQEKLIIFHIDKTIGLGLILQIQQKEHFFNLQFEFHSILKQIISK
jgi:F0F1-type ATP synthase delta subunit